MVDLFIMQSLLCGGFHNYDKLVIIRVNELYMKDENGNGVLDLVIYIKIK